VLTNEISVIIYKIITNQ